MSETISVHNMFSPYSAKKKRFRQRFTCSIMSEIIKSEKEDTGDSLFDYEVFANSLFGDINSSKIDDQTVNNFSDNQTVNDFSENNSIDNQIPSNFSDIFETRGIDFNIKSNEKGQIEVDISLEKQDGIIIGVVAFALIILQIGIYCYIRRVRKRKR